MSTTDGLPLPQAHPASPAVAGPPVAPGTGRERLGDRVFREVCRAAAIFVVALAALLVAVLVWQSWLSIRTVGIRFLTRTTWDPEPTHQIFGALAFVYGTIASSAIALLIAVPLGVGTAVFLSEVAPRRVRRPASFLVEMLAAVPSVVYGFWGLFVLAPVVHRLASAVGASSQGGVGLLSAGLILAVMIVPYVAALSYEACRACPQTQREGALALGATRWQMICAVVLPHARSGITGGCFLALGRALGETMAVTMLIGNRAGIRLSPFAPADSIASAIANQFTEATGALHLSALVELALLLFVVTAGVNALARGLIARAGRVRPRTGGGWRDWWARRAPAELPAAHRAARNRRIDRLMTAVLWLCTFATVTPLFLVLGHLLSNGVGTLNWQFFVCLPAAVGEPGGGMANAIVGSAMLVGLATLFAAPVGVLAAVYLTEYRNGRLARAVRFVGELLGGVPSIVVGIFVYVLVVVPTGRFSGWAGSFALALVMLPVVLRSAEEALKLVPRSLREAADALGATRWQAVLRVCLPAALPAVVTGVLLAAARVAGETAPLLLTAATNQFWPSGPGDFTPSLPVYVFNYAVSPYPDWHRQAWAAALVLLGAVVLLNAGVRLATGRSTLSLARAG